MTTELKTFPPLSEVAIIAICGLAVYATGPDWLVNLYRVGTAIWLLTFVYAVIRRHYATETTR